MFSINLKLSNKRIAVIFIVFVVAVISVVLLRLYFLNKPTENGIECSTEVDVNEYLASFGLQLGECTVDEIIVPYEFNDVYKNYNKIQQSQGFDLADYKGKKLFRYTFSVQNYPDSDSVFAEVLIYRKQIVGADIYSTDLDGFIVPLK